MQRFHFATTESSFVCLIHFTPGSVDPLQLFLFKLDRKLYFSASNMARVLGVRLIIAGAVQNDGNSTMQVDRPHDVPDEQGGSAADGDSSSDDLTELRRVEWERAEEKYGPLAAGPWRDSCSCASTDYPEICYCPCHMG